jgi:hypothetical protein
MTDIEKYCKLVTDKKLTCVGHDRLIGAFRKVEDVIQQNVPGAIVECGTYKGGCLALMARAAIESGRLVWGFDTFEGIPIPGEKDGKKSKGRGGSNDLNASLEVAWSSFDVLGVPHSSIKLVKGLFQDTIHTVKADIGPIAVLRLDGDWYESTKVCLENLYDQVSFGGYIIIDDYGHWEGCKLAVDEFLTTRNITVELSKTDYTERWWKKV